MMFPDTTPPPPTPEHLAASLERKREMNKLIGAVRNLEANADWQRVKGYLFYLAPPNADCFQKVDGYNPQGAAKRDGMQFITRTIKNLTESKEEPEGELPQVKAQFTGDKKP